MSEPTPPLSAAQRHRRIRVLQAACAALWLAVTVAVIWFARELDQNIGHWPLGFWLAAQGVVLFYVALVAFYAVLMQKFEDPQPEEGPPGSARTR